MDPRTVRVVVHCIVFFHVRHLLKRGPTCFKRPRQCYTKGTRVPKREKTSKAIINNHLVTNRLFNNNNSNNNNNKTDNKGQQKGNENDNKKNRPGWSLSFLISQGTLMRPLCACWISISSTWLTLVKACDYPSGTWDEPIHPSRLHPGWPNMMLLFFWCITGIIESLKYDDGTVHGRNPAPPGMYKAL